MKKGLIVFIGWVCVLIGMFVLGASLRRLMSGSYQFVSPVPDPQGIRVVELTPVPTPPR